MFDKRFPLNLIIVMGVILTAYGIYDMNLFGDKKDPKKPQPTLVALAQETQAAQNPIDVQDVQSDISAVLRSVRPCVVQVIAYVTPVMDQPDQVHAQNLDPFQKGNSQISSGLIVSADGLIVTTKEAVPSNQLEVKIYRGRPNVFKATIVKVADVEGLAVIKLDGAADLNVCKWGDSSQVKVGDIVFAIGSPYGFSNSVSSGIISKASRKVILDGATYELLQTDVAMSEGNNGGALMNVDGEVIGMNSAIYAAGGHSEGVGFSIPSNDIKAFLKNVEFVK